MFGSTPSNVRRLLGYVKQPQVHSGESQSPTGDGSSSSTANTSNEDEGLWVEKAIKSLVKKLKKGSQLEELEKAICNEDMNTKCVTIPRSLDGRLQVQQKKGLPHVMYCRLWRWPDLGSHHELRHVDHCAFAFPLKKDEVCVNPYHYVRLENQFILQTSILARNLPNIDNVEPMDVSAPDSIHSLGDKDRSAMLNVPSNADLPLSALPVTVKRESQDSDTVTGPSASSAAAGVYSPSPTSPHSPNMSSASTGHMTHSPFPFNTVGSSGVVSPDATSSHVGSPAALGSPSALGIAGAEAPSPSAYFSEDNADSDQNMEQVLRSPEVYSMHAASALSNSCMQGKEHPWCSLHYYELQHRVGDTFHVRVPEVRIDGGTSPSDKNRFCLGSLNNANRPIHVETARKFIGRGIRLLYQNGEVHIESESDCPMFVQSANGNLHRDWHAATVCRIPPGCNFCIFRDVDFAEQLRTCVRQGYEAVYALTKMCTIRVSFVKGWGADYRRQTITSTPCWLEVHLNLPLQWLDNVLFHMGSPRGQCSSMS